MPIDPLQPKKKTQTDTGGQPPTDQPSPTPAPTPAPTTPPARPTNPPVPGSGPNGPTNQAATPPVTPPANPQQQYQGSGYVNGQRYMDLLGPTFQQQAQAQAQAAGSRAAQTQAVMGKAAQQTLGVQQNSEIGDPGNIKGVRDFKYQGPANLKESMDRGLAGDTQGMTYDDLVRRAAVDGDEARTMGSDAGLSSYLAQQTGQGGAMSDLDAALLGMGTTGFGDNARRYGDLLGSLDKNEKAIGGQYTASKASSEKRQADLLKANADAKKAGYSELRENARDTRNGDTRPTKGIRNPNTAKPTGRNF